MIVMIIYTLMAMAGEVVAYGAGLVIDREIPEYSMILYMALFFGVLFGMWPLAVMVTERYFVKAA